MAKSAMKEKQKRGGRRNGKACEVRSYTRCSLCGRPHAVLRKYGICRVCFRKLVLAGEIPGFKKASW
ncbi:MAG: type Z 30S ribosomal protein S14 [Christensenellaceae bacterium]|jgi:small subunit ribosomal protein S14|nr:type Z 30S ribosomal protein S14 [Christensenellaceae bacterium]